MKRPNEIADAAMRCVFLASVLLSLLFTLNHGGWYLSAVTTTWTAERDVAGAEIALFTEQLRLQTRAMQTGLDRKSAAHLASLDTETLPEWRAVVSAKAKQDAVDAGRHRRSVEFLLACAWLTLSLAGTRVALSEKNLAFQANRL